MLLYDRSRKLGSLDRRQILVTVSAAQQSGSLAMFAATPPFATDMANACPLPSRTIKEAAD
jgi:hypothetical protein